MRIRFLGAARTVTGSKHLITTAGGLQILLDCGMYQGKGADNDTVNRHLGFDPRQIDYLLLSHAHIDHSGLIPLMTSQGFRGKILATPATVDMCDIMLRDSAKIQEQDAEYINKKRKRKGKKPIEPLYRTGDAIDSMSFFEPVGYGESRTLADGVSFHFTDAGHILGSAAINLALQDNARTIRLTFTGDTGRPGNRILRAPAPFPQADYIIAESTYGDRLHEPPGNMQEHLMRVVTETCVMQRGKIIIPAFSIGRTQEIVYALDRLNSSGKLPPLKVFVDSPLSTNATDIMRSHPECFNDEVLRYMKSDPDPFGFRGLTFIKDVEESKKLNGLEEPCIIISSSGMAEAGRVKHHIKNNIHDPRNCILIVGYCPPDTLGGRLKNGHSRVSIFGDEFEVKARVEVMDAFSAHGDYREMIDYLSCQDPAGVEKVFLVHGEYEAQLAYKEHLHKAGYRKIDIPLMHSVHDLD